MQTPPVRLPLPPGTTAHQLMAQGMPESSAYRILKQGWYCPGYNQRAYPQHDGPGGFAHLETPERFVRAYVLRTLAQWAMAPSPDLVEDQRRGVLAQQAGDDGLRARPLPQPRPGDDDAAVPGVDVEFQVAVPVLQEVKVKLSVPHGAVTTSAVPFGALSPSGKLGAISGGRCVIEVSIPGFQVVSLDYA